MSARLPQPGSDDGTWGEILNGFLTVVHNADGTLQSGIVTDANIAATAAIARTKLDASTQASLNKADTALQSAPVTSVNSKMGAVSLTASDVGADASGAAAAAQAASLQITKNLSDLNSVTTARTNLGLGGAATLNVGTTTGTVAAGDDSRLAAASTAVQSVNSKTGTAVSLTTTDIPGTLDSRTITKASLAGYAEQITTNANSGTAVTYDATAKNVYDTTLTANVTVTLVAGSAGSVSELSIIHRQDATGGRTVTWPASVKWPNGAAPSPNTAVNAINIYSLFTVDGGTTWFGFLAGRGMA